MTCNPRNVSEISGSYVSCQILIVRECLSVNGQDIVPGGNSHSDGVTLQGDGSLVAPFAIKQVEHDGSLAGAGTVASPLSVTGLPASLDHIDLVDGAAVGLAPAGIVRIRQVGGLLQMSYSGGAFVDIVTA